MEKNYSGLYGIRPHRTAFVQSKVWTVTQIKQQSLGVSIACVPQEKALLSHEMGKFTLAVTEMQKVFIVSSV